MYLTYISPVKKKKKRPLSFNVSIKCKDRAIRYWVFQTLQAEAAYRLPNVYNKYPVGNALLRH